MIILPSTRGFPEKSIIDSVSVPTTWDIGIRTTATNKQMRFNTGSTGGTGDVTIDWGDGTIQTLASFSGFPVLHDYADAAKYTVKISGAFGTSGTISINTTSATLVVSTSAIPNIKLSTFNNLFLNCNNLIKVPSNLFHYNTTLTTGTNIFSNVFSGCSKLTSIPVDLFIYHTGLTSNAFNATFRNCISLTNIPSNLFKYNINITTGAFINTFNGCRQLLYVPIDLFRYNTAITTNAFNNTFTNCSRLSEISKDIFRYNTLLSTACFNSTFNNCTGLNGYAIDADLLRYNINLSGTDTANTMFNAITLNTVAYSNLLISLDTYLTQSNLGFGAGNSKYNSSASTARANLVARGWNIIDGGLA